MKLVELNFEQLNSFLVKQDKAQFLQSASWLKMQENFNQAVFCFGVLNNGGEVIASALLLKKKLFKQKFYFYCPRGPILINNLEVEQKLELVNFLFSEISKIAAQENCLFLRFEPQVNFENINLKLVVKKTLDIQPSQTLMLDLNKSEDELLSEMHSKTRYNLRLAEKKGVAIIKDKTRFEEFWKLLEDTKERDGFRIHGHDYYQAMLTLPETELFLAIYNNQVIAGGLMSFFGDMAVYIHGASANIERQLMAPYLVQWEAIKEAKLRNCQYYDFYGIDEIKWPGVTRFKIGFGGEVVKFPGTFDVIFNNFWYHTYNYLRALRRLLKFIK